MHTITRSNYVPKVGDYHNIVVHDPIRGKLWLFDCDGVYSNITGSDIAVTNELGQSEGVATSQKLVTDQLALVESSISEAGSQIDELDTKISQETADRESADETLGGRITAVEEGADALSAAQQETVDNLMAEVSTRQAADINLQTQIDGITASSDVKDVVGTKAELDQYDTSTLGLNDIIKVLQDEAENDATTYYRWTGSAFTLIGEEGPYYTKAQSDSLLAEKASTSVLAEVALTGNYDDLENTPEPYALPAATTSTLGGIKVGDNLSVSKDGTLNASAGVQPNYEENDSNNPRYIRNRPFYEIPSGGLRVQADINRRYSEATQWSPEVVGVLHSPLWGSPPVLNLNQATLGQEITLTIENLATGEFRQLTGTVQRQEWEDDMPHDVGVNYAIADATDWSWENKGYSPTIGEDISNLHMGSASFMLVEKTRPAEDVWYSYFFVISKALADEGWSLVDGVRVSYLIPDGTGVLKQLDSKFIKIDNNTIKVDENDKLYTDAASKQYVDAAVASAGAATLTNEQFNSIFNTNLETA